MSIHPSLHFYTPFTNISEVYLLKILDDCFVLLFFRLKKSGAEVMHLFCLFLNSPIPSSARWPFSTVSHGFDFLYIPDARCYFKCTSQIVSLSLQFSRVQSLSCVRLFVTPHISSSLKIYLLTLCCFFFIQKFKILTQPIPSIFSISSVEQGNLLPRTEEEC